MSKTVFITGASSGIGQATALYFADMGWNVAATMREKTDNKNFAGHTNIKQYHLDVTDVDSITSAINGALKDFGSIDALINNAGYATIGPFEASTAAQIQQQFAVNVFGGMDLTRQIIPIMRTQGHGHIVNVSSMGGRLAFPLYSAYHATKWAVEGFSESLMYELQAFNIHIKLIEPGIIKTQFKGSSEVRFARKEIDDYDIYATHINNGYNHAYGHASSPQKVAKTIYKAASSSSAKLRYAVGQPAPILLAFRRILPEGWFFALIRRGAK